MTKSKTDKKLIIPLFILLIVGLIVLINASSIISHDEKGNSYYYFLHQLIYGIGTGLVVFFFCQGISYKKWKKLSLLILFFAFLLSILVFIPGLGFKHAGAQRWLIIGPLSFQPSEFLKLAFIIYLAAFLSKKESYKINTLIPFLVIMTIIGGLMAFQSDLGTLILISVVGFIIYFVGGAKIYQLITVVLIYLGSFFLLVRLFPHRMSRFIAFLNPSVDPQGISYQINQALLAIGSGGIAGRGLGDSQQKYHYLPEAMGDSIFAIFAEEVGFLGCVVLIFLFLWLAFRGFKIASKSKDDFAKLLAIGITSWVIIQAFINIAGITSLIPLTGIPLPFISFGGTAMISLLAGMGILINISKQTN